MNIRPLFRILTAALVMVAPAVLPAGQLMLVATAASLTIYEGVRARVVYTVLAMLVVTEVFYGGDIGSVSIAYIGTVLLYGGLRRFITIPAWAARDGWRIWDAVRTVAVAWVFVAVVLSLSIGVGSLLYAYTQPWDRWRIMATAGNAWTALAVCAVVCVILRRMTVPFRHAILFGT